MNLLILLVCLGLLLLLLIPIVPRLFRFRMAVLLRIGLGSLAHWHEEHFDALVLFARIMCVMVAILFFVLAALT